MSNISRLLLLATLAFSLLTTLGVSLMPGKEATSAKLEQKIGIPILRKSTIPGKQIEIYLRDYCCNKTTEHGADEIYFLVYGRRTDGLSYSQRWPGPYSNQAAGHWNMNDNTKLPTNNPHGDSLCIHGKSLFIGELPPGQSWDVIVMACEEDGGNSKDIQSVMGNLATKVPNPYVAAAGTVVAALAELGINITDSDDYIGSFATHLTNKSGNITAEWRAVDRVVHSIPEPEEKDNPLHREFRMNGDGSNYVGWYHIR